MSQKLDIVYALDNSRDVSPGTLDAMKKFLKASLNLYEVSIDKANVGLGTASSSFASVLQTNAGINKHVVNALLNTIQISTNGMSMMNILEDARKNAFTTSRSDAKKVLVVFVAGQSSLQDGFNEDLKDRVKDLQTDGVSVFVVSVGNVGNSDEVKTVLSTGVGSYVSSKSTLPDGLGELERYLGTLARK